MTSLSKKNESQRWINALVAGVSILSGYLLFKFCGQLSEWFALEAKIKSYMVISQIVSGAVAIGMFVILLRNANIAKYLEEVYAEAVKVIWPDKDSTVKLTIGIVIAVAIAAACFSVIDIVIRKLLSFLY